MSPWKELGISNWVPGRQPSAVRPNSGEPAAVSGRARVGERPAGLWDSIPGLGLAETAAGVLERRPGAAPAAATPSPARGEAKLARGCVLEH
jgi:hypothetical protein